VQYRNEIKHLITSADRAAICAVICAVMKVEAQLDPHAQAKGYYTIRACISTTWRTRPCVKSSTASMSA